MKSDDLIKNQHNYKNNHIYKIVYFVNPGELSVIFVFQGVICSQTDARQKRAGIQTPILTISESAW